MLVFPEHIGRYRVCTLLGQGAMGVVYHAHDDDLGRDVAIKVLDVPDDAAPEATARFANEARLLAALTNPHIVQIHDYHAGPPPWLVMEYVRGQSLRSLIAERGPQSAAVVADCAAQLLAGLAAAHEAGILHRDLKPANVLLSEHGVFKLADFGLARRVSEQNSLTSVGVLVGTLRYFAPELVQDCVATPASDLYALGMTLIELAGGANPFAAPGSLVERLRRVTEQPLPPTLAVLPSLPAELATWLDRLVARSPADRFASARVALATLPDGLAERSATAIVAMDVEREHSSTTARQGTITATVRPRSLGSGTTRRLARAAVPQATPYRLAAQIVAVMWLACAAGALAVGWLVAAGANARHLSDLQEHLRASAATAALMIDGDAQGVLAREPRLGSPAWDTVRSGLRRFRSANPGVANLLTMAELPDTAASGVLLITCDDADAVDENGNGVIDPQEDIAEPGGRFDLKPYPRMIDGLSVPSVDDALTRDHWGEWLSGYAPIRDSTGQVTGMVVLDVAAGDISALVAQSRREIALVLAPTLAATLLLAIFFARRLNRPLLAVQKALVAAAQGDYSQVPTVRGGPFAVLASATAHLVQELRGTMELRTALVRVLSHALDNRHDTAQTVSGPCAVLACRLGEVDGAVLNARLALLVEVVREYDGIPHRVSGKVLSAVFPVRAGSTHAQERAVRAALLLVEEADGHPTSLRLGVASGRDSVEATTRAEEICRANLEFGSDLLIGDDDFLPLRPMFIADRLTVRSGEVVYAIKGTVS